MTKDLLPKKIDLKKLCQSHAELKGQLVLANFPRLQQVIKEMNLDSEQTLSLQGAASLTFSLGNKNQRLIQGRVMVQLPATCQRCLGHFMLQVEIPIHLAQWSSLTPPKDELLPEDFDWLVSEEDSISLTALLEDDLLLGIPPAPSHPIDQCDAEMLKQLAVEDIPEPPKQVESSQFFQALSLLKQQELQQKKPKE